MDEKTTFGEVQDSEETAEMEDSPAEGERKKRIYWPRLDTLEDVHRQIKRLFAESINPDAATALPTERLRVASALLTLARSVLTDLEAKTQRAADADEGSQEQGRPGGEPRPPAVPEFRPPPIPARFIVPKP